MRNSGIRSGDEGLNRCPLCDWWSPVREDCRLVQGSVIKQPYCEWRAAATARAEACCKGSTHRCPINCHGHRRSSLAASQPQHPRGRWRQLVIYLTVQRPAARSQHSTPCDAFIAPPKMTKTRYPRQWERLRDAIVLSGRAHALSAGSARRGHSGEARQKSKTHKSHADRFARCKPAFGWPRPVRTLL